VSSGQPTSREAGQHAEQLFSPTGQMYDDRRSNLKGDHAETYFSLQHSFDFMHSKRLKSMEDNSI